MRLTCMMAALLTIVVPLSAQTFRAGVTEDPQFVGGSPYSATITGDGLTIYWTASRAGGLGGRDIWTMTRPNISAAWASPTNVNALNSPLAESYIDVRDDDQEMFISRGGMIYSATRTITGWGAPSLTNTSALNLNSFQDDPSVTRDGLEMYFTTDPGPGANIWRSFRPSNTAPWGAPQLVTVVNSTSFDHSPAISGDGLCIIFSSNRPGGGGGSSDHWMATRSDRGTTAAPTPFSAPVALTNLNTSAWDHNGQQSADGFSFYYSTSAANISRADRDLPVIYGPNGPPQVGNPFTIYVRRDALAGQVGVIMGTTTRLPTPVTFPGVIGQLELNPSPGSLFWLTSGGVNSTDGKYTVNVPVPNIGGLAGQSVHFQGGVQSPGTIWIGAAKKYTIAP